MNQPTTRDIIDALGGVNHVANKICVDRHMVDNWMRPTRGIASAYWIDILELARRQGVKWITSNALKRAKGSYARKIHESL
jgi:predicted GNAT superfamily acetyltransferase